MAKIDDNVVRMLEKRLGQPVTTPDGATNLRMDIESVTGEYLALNTVKRLVGLLPYEYSFRPFTLDIIGRYLGFDSWGNLQEYMADHISGFGENESLIDAASLPYNQELEIRWSPDRKIRLRHNDKGIFVVIESENSKLRINDILTLSMIGPGIPFMCRSVIRDGVELGTFTAAAETGIKYVELL